jgi:hypothetical protein
MVFVNAVKPGKVGNIMSALQGVVARSPDCREDVLEGPGGAPTIHRFLRGVQGPRWAVQGDYLISFGGAWASATASSRAPGEGFDVTPIDQLLLAFRLADRPRPECEVSPAWRTYQERRRPGSPIAKVVLYMDPAPVCLGSYQTGLADKTRFTPSDFRRGGRQITPDLIEFYAKEDTPSIRVDFWLDSQPDAKGREPVFEARLRVDGRSFSVWSFVEPYEVPIPPGEYDVSITRLDRGKHSERALTDEERFDRDDLERYEVLLRRRPADCRCVGSAAVAGLPDCCRVGSVGDTRSRVEGDSRSAAKRCGSTKPDPAARGPEETTERASVSSDRSAHRDRRFG